MTVAAAGDFIGMRSSYWRTEDLLKLSDAHSMGLRTPPRTAGWQGRQLLKDGQPAGLRCAWSTCVQCWVTFRSDLGKVLLRSRGDSKAQQGTTSSSHVPSLALT
ncbi:unnamed protein product [Symbiodinium sp. CCMP2592]|nr:unnamed protein product [Symbiodinium sp. CCMP2592]